MVAELWRYPVKSMGGERLTTAELDRRGIVGDRRWAVRTADGKLGSGKDSRRFRRVSGLLHLRSRVDGDTPVITFPDGSELRGEGPAVDAALAVSLDMPGVALRPEAETPHFDAAGVHLISSSGVEWLGDALPGAELDARRFRPNMLLRTAGTERPEEEWVGRALTVGTAHLRVTGITERCAMVTADQPGIDHDARILRSLAERNDLHFGVYAEVVVPGTIQLGDPVRT